MELKDYLNYLNSGKPVVGGVPARVMRKIGKEEA